MQSSKTGIPRPLQHHSMNALFLDFNVGTISMLHEGGGRAAGAAGEGIRVMGAAETCHSTYHTWDGPSTQPNALCNHGFPS